MCVLNCCVVHEWWMRSDKTWRRDRVPILAYSYGKSSRRVLGLTSRSDGGGWGSTQTSDWGSHPASLLIPFPGRHLKFLPCRGSSPGSLLARRGLCLCTTAVNGICYYILIYKDHARLRKKHVETFIETNRKRFKFLTNFLPPVWQNWDL